MAPYRARLRRRKQRIAARDGGWYCTYCGEALDPIVDASVTPPEVVTATTPTLDHVIPRSKGGSNRLSNLVLSCFPCNQDKANGEPATEMAA